jgi:ABC-type dipeptide/oligopeptide/nickel transport system permease subunit
VDLVHEAGRCSRVLRSASIRWSTNSGLAILVSVLGFNLLGDGLRDALDPRLRGGL